MQPAIFLQLTKMHFGTDSTRPKDSRLWLNLDHIQAIIAADRTHTMHGSERKYTYVYTRNDDDPWTVTETPEEIFRIMSVSLPIV